MAVNKESRNLFTLLSAGLALGVLVVSNLLADRVFLRLDLTEEGRYSLSRPFYSILSKLESPLKLTYYVSEKVPAEFETGKRDLMDKLREIETAAKGKVVLELVDPTHDEALKKKLAEESPYMVSSVKSVEKDKVSVANFYSVLRLTYQHKPPIPYPRVYNAEELEYLLANGILALTQKEKPVISIYAPRPPRPRTPGASAPPSDGFEWLFQAKILDERFDKRRVEFTEASSIPEKTRLLIVLRPKALSERAQYEITRYLAQGGKVCFISSPWEIDLEYGNIEPVKSGLDGYLGTLGVGWVPAFVCDESNAPLPRIKKVQALEFMEYEPHPFFVRVLPQNLDLGNPITRFLPSLVLPYSSAFTLDAEKSAALGLTLDILAKTSDHSWTEPVGAFLDVRKPIQSPAKYDRPRPVFLRLTGRFPFPWAGKTLPEWPAPDPRGTAGADPAKKGAPQPVPALEDGGGAQEGMLFLFACPESFHGTYLFHPKLQETFTGNGNVLLNVIETCGLGDDLVKIRTKRYETRGIQKFEGKDGETKRNAIKLALVIIVVLLVLAFAVVRWAFRRDRQVRYERGFSASTGPSSFTP